MKNYSSNTLGTHLVCDFWGAEKTKLEDTTYLRNLLIEASNNANAIVIDVAMHKFKPEGITIVALLAESHVSIHTWPEEDYAAIDVFTCGDRMNPYAFLEALERELSPKTSNIEKISRGNLDDKPK